EAREAPELDQRAAERSAARQRLLRALAPPAALDLAARDAARARGPAGTRGAIIERLAEVLEASIRADAALDTQAESSDRRAGRQLGLESLEHAAPEQCGIEQRGTRCERRVPYHEVAAPARLAFEAELRARSAPGVRLAELPRRPRAGRGARHAREVRADREPEIVVAVPDEVA